MISLPVDETFEHKGILGRGGMSRVIRVRARNIPVDVALKIPLTDSSSDSDNFSPLAQREFELIGALSFPGLVRLLEKPSQQAKYLLMELCHGPTLDTISPPAKLSTYLNLLSALSASLEYIRTQGIIHGDLKPQNIFLPAGGLTATEGGLFYLKLADFAFGRFIDEADENRLGIGTVGYMPPETVLNSQTSHSSDIFALGVIAYELLTGAHPFGEQDDDPTMINSRVRELDPKQPHEIRTDCPAKLSDLIMRLLAKDPAERPKSPWEVCLLLETCGANYPFRKALRPRHLYNQNSDYKTNVRKILEFDEKKESQLNALCNDDPTRLRLVLDANFRKENLVYDNSKFRFVNNIYWPDYLRRRTLNSFTQGAYSKKKQLINQAISFCAGANKSIIHDQGSSTSVPPALFDLLLAFLSAKTIRRISQKTAPRFESTNDYETATRLYLWSGDIESTERCALVAVNEFRKKHQLPQALTLLSTVNDYARSLNKLFEIRQLIMSAADIYKDQGNATAAIGLYDSIVDLYEGKTHDSLLAETYKDLGDCYYIKQDYERGISSLQKSLNVFTEIGDELEISHTYNNIGNINRLINNFDDAITNYRLALRIQHRLMAQGDIASTLNNIATIYCMQGRLHRSLRLFHLSLKIQTEAGLAGDSARTRNNLGYVYHLRGESSKAIEQLTESLRINRRIGNKVEILHNLENLSTGMITAGQLRSLITHLKEGIELSTTLGDKSHLGQFQLFMAIVCKRTGKFQKTREALSVVEDLLKDIDNPLLEIALLTQRGSLAMISGDMDYAKEHLTKSLTLADKSGDATSQLNVLLSLVQIDNSPDLTKRTEELIKGLHLKRESKLIQFYAIAKAMEDSDNIPGNLSLPIIPESNDDIELPRMCIIASEFYLKNREIHKSAELSERALRVATTMGLVPELVASHYLIGKVSAELGEYEKAFGSFRAGLKAASTLNAELDSDDARKTFQQTRLMTALASEIKRLKTKLVRK